VPNCPLELDRLRLVVDPGLGAAIRRLDLAGPDGVFHPLLRPTPETATTRGQTSCFLMLPWVGRIPGGRFRFRGREHELRRDSNDRLHAIHGDVTQRVWTVTDRSPVSIRMEFDATGRRVPDRNWPWDYIADMRYELTPDSVRLELGITNASGEPFPVGAGFHPYFQRRLWAEGADDSCTVRAPVAGRYPLTNLAATGPAVHDAACRTVAHGSELSEPTDDVFLRGQGDPTITWKASGVRVRLRADESLTHLVLWAPHEQGRRTGFLCVEPLSTTTDAFNLHARDQAGTGVRVLEPGDRASFGMSLTVEPGKD
jgi:aldose 1-epimerase